MVYIAHPGNTSPLNSSLLVHKITEENYYHIALMVPQWAVMTAGEVMFSLTGLQFAFSQAPESMRAVLQAAYTVTTGIGNIIDVTVMLALEGVLSRAYLFFLFAGLMTLDMALLAFMAARYKYVNFTNQEKSA